MSDKRKVAIYCRVAREDADAIKHQEVRLREYVKQQGFLDIAVYSDNGFSGIRFDRPAFMRMESDIAAGKINTIVCKDISRIGRGYLDVSAWLDKMKRNGISIISVDDGAMDSTFINVGDLIRQAYHGHRAQQR